MWFSSSVFDAPSTPGTVGAGARVERGATWADATADRMHAFSDEVFAAMVAIMALELGAPIRPRCLVFPQSRLAQSEVRSRRARLSSSRSRGEKIRHGR